MNAEEIVHTARAIRDPQRQANFVEEACGGDEDLRKRVQSFLQSNTGDPANLDAPATHDSTRSYETPPAVEGDCIGRYKCLQKLGEGAMGVVFMAEQTDPVRRRVALKIIKPGMDSAQVLARFDAERQALALMNHDFIARVYDVGTVSEPGARGRPYFAMELVKGIPVTKFCDEQKLDIDDRLRLFVSICQAVQHAHLKGVIHRDLKPSNMLVGLVDGRAVPKVIDFGLAKAMHQPLTDRTMVTNIGSILGTLEYMSPEQADLSALDIDTRTDIYSLGVILYELLTGTTPLGHARLREQGYSEAVRLIRETEPMRPSTQLSHSGKRLAEVAALRHVDPASLRKRVRGDLDWIVMKALDKNRAGRYQTANELAADIERYLKHEPIMARPPSLWYPVQRLMRRNRAAVVGAGVFVLTLVAASVLSSWLAVRAWDAERDARAAEEQSRREKERALHAEKDAREAEAEAKKGKVRAEAAEKDAALQAEEAKNAAAIAKAVNDFLRNDVLAQANPFKQFGPNQKPDPNLSLRTVLDRAAKKIKGRFPNQPLVEAAIQRTIGETYEELGLIKSAEPHLKAAIDLYQKHRGDNHPDTTQTRLKLTGIYWNENKYAAMEEILVPLVAAYRQQFGSEDLRTLAPINQLGLCYQEQRKFAQAEACFLEAYEGRRKLLGDEDPVTLNSVNCLGYLYFFGLRQFDRAEPYYVKALELRRKKLPRNHPFTQNSVRSLALLYGSMGKHEAAEPLFREALAMSRATFGEENDRTVSATRELGAFLAQRRQFKEAEPLLRKALASNLRSHDDSWGGTYASLRELASCLLLKGDLEESLSLSRRYDAAVVNDGKEDPLLIGMAKELLGSVLLASGQPKDAEAELTEGLAVCVKHAPEIWWRFRIAALLGESLAKQRKFGDAEPLLIQGYEGMANLSATIPASRKHQIADTGAQIVQLYEAWGNASKAKEWRERLNNKK